MPPSLIETLKTLETSFSIQFATTQNSTGAGEALTSQPLCHHDKH